MMFDLPTSKKAVAVFRRIKFHLPEKRSRPRPPAPATFTAFLKDAPSTPAALSANPVSRWPVFPWRLNARGVQPTMCDAPEEEMIFG